MPGLLLLHEDAIGINFILNGCGIACLKAIEESAQGEARKKIEL
jgi:hypothetical protein